MRMRWVWWYYVYFARNIAFVLVWMSHLNLGRLFYLLSTHHWHQVRLAEKASPGMLNSSWKEQSLYHVAWPGKYNLFITTYNIWYNLNKTFKYLPISMEPIYCMMMLLLSWLFDTKCLHLQDHVVFFKNLQCKWQFGCMMLVVGGICIMVYIY